MRIISSLVCMLCITATVKAVESSSSMATQLADCYLKSFTEGTPPLPKQDQAKKTKPSDINITDTHLSPRTERAVVFNQIFAKSNFYNDCYQQASSLLNPYVWNDLHLFCGTTTTPAYHFFSRINKTITVLGEAALASLLAAPVASMESLSKRQRYIDFFCQNKELSSDIKTQIQDYKSSEKNMLSFWTETDPLYGEAYNKYLTGLFYTKSPASNKLASPLQTRKILLRDIWNIYSKYVWYPLVVGIPTTEIANPVLNITRKECYKYVLPVFVPIYNFTRISNIVDWVVQRNNLNKKAINEDFKNESMILKNIYYTYSGVITIHSLYQYYIGYCNYKEYAGVLRHLALRMADVQTFLVTAQKVNELVHKNADLEALYGPQLKPIRDLLARAKESSEVGNLLRYLQELPLRSWSYFCSNAGKLLASYKLFVEHKASFHDAMYALGELDAFLSIATLMQETAAMNGPHGYTFTKLLSPKSYTKPRLAIAGMWNPMLNPSEAVGNDVMMGQTTQTQTIVLTGPNAGGKSTFLTGVATTVLLSQTFGIAPAKSCEMTLFSKINTYIDITDDIAAGKSLFLAEVDRFHSHLRILKRLKESEFSFSIFDEPFNGTNPVEGGAAEYSVLNYIGQYSNALNIVATHYPIIMLLEEREPAKGFKNYKVYIKPIGKDGKIHYTYKIVPGASNQTIAIDILAEQGYATEMLQQARDIISHPEAYNKNFSNSAADPKRPKKNARK